MDEVHVYSGDPTLWIIGIVAIVIALVAMFFWYKGRPMPGAHVFRASRMSRGNLLLPAQVAVTPTSVVFYKPAVVGGREQSIHLAHVASVRIDRNLFFADVMIESSGGIDPVRCYGHRKRDAVAMKQLIEQFQTDYYRAHGPAPRREGDEGTRT
jgi:hypothetical protein